MRFSTIFVPALVAGLPVMAFTQNPDGLKSGAVIINNTTFTPGTYTLPSVEGTRRVGDEEIPDLKPALIIRGNGITVDFKGATLLGTPSTTDPHERKGLAILVEGKNVTIRNLKVRGYKVGIMAKDAPGLKILDSDLSYNWKQHLGSTQEREDASDWMSYHHNEKDEWLRYGAAIYLRDCDGFEVKGVRVHGGQNALMITGCDKGKVWNNDFSFNSSLGLGMYRSSDNKIMHNRMDWNVRGFSYGVYNRGQDSAGILIYEQSHRNTFAYNSVTHGGDGFFLWAGQSTMDTGEGGCNDNLLVANDWSHAPTNGIEATFSRNAFVNNKIHECAHGVWGGYSYDTVVALNDFADNQAAIALEHGQANRYLDNTFFRDDVAISLWANPTQDPNWGYGKKRDTRSRDSIIQGNLFFGNGVAFDQRRTTGTVIKGNTLVDVLREIRVPEGETPPAASNVTATKVEARRWSPWTRLTGAYAKYNVPRMRGGIDPFLKPGAKRGWKYIMVDEWGPYDFKRPLLWPERTPLAGDAPRPGANSAAGSGRPKPQAPKQTGATRYELLGPKGKWRLVSAEGAKLSATSGEVPGFVTIELEKGRVGNTKIDLEYIGAETFDYRGNPTPAGQPVRFGFERFHAPIDWTVDFFKWTESVNASDPIAIPKADLLAEIIKGTPIHTLKTDRLDYASGGSFYPGGPTDKFATVANGTFEVPAGEYTLDVTTDDGIRVWLDGKLILESWKHQGPTPYTKDLTLGGKHTMRVEHFEIGGYAALNVKLKPKK
ncbi:MAG: right-handed parallel beta-helix repeat-containing protein [Fimbriimonas sp.]